MDMNTNGSLQNLMLHNAKPATPTVGMGATEVRWTDRRPYTVVEVKSDRRVVVKQDNWTRTDTNGMSDAQTYTFEPNPDASPVVLSLRKDGKWKMVGDTQVFVLGTRQMYYDFGF